MTVPHDPNVLLASARRHHRESDETILAESYPAVHRMARGLTGHEAAARAVVETVLRRSLRVMPQWRPGSITSNWFYHHTLLAARATARPTADVRDDPLVVAAETTEPGYLAFIAALRKLPPQQMEAFLLHHGERLNPRLLGVAMDCSMDAAVNHLNAATEALNAVAGEGAAISASVLSKAYWSLTPAEAGVLPEIKRRVRAARWSRRLRRLVRRLVVLGTLAAFGWAAWRWHEPAVQWLQHLLQP